MSVKKQILEIVEAMEEQIGKETMPYLFCSEQKNDNKKIGCNQFREIASICRQAESYEELKLMIQYNIAKANDDESWKKKCRNQIVFGDIVLEAMEKVRAIDEDKVLDHLELYFGYLYWQARVWTDQYRIEKKKDGKPYKKYQQNPKPYGTKRY